MEEEKKNPPTEVVDTGDKKVSSAEEGLAKKVKTLEEEKETLNKRLKDKDEMIGKQSSEIGDLRKEKPPEGEKVDSDVDELAKSLEKEEGMDRDTALYNAKLLIKTDRKLQSKRMMNDVSDMIEDAVDEGKIDKKIFEENQDAIFQEFRGRKVAPTARKNFRIFRDCVDVVTKRKAEELRKANEKPSEEKRTDLINAGAQAPGGGAEVKDTAAEKEKENIRNAGTNREGAFF